MATPMTNATNAGAAAPGSPLSYGGLLTFGLGASVHLGTSVDIVAESYGTQLAGHFRDTGALSMEALGGFKFYIHGPNYLMVAGGAGIPIDSGFQQANWRQGVLAKGRSEKA